MLNRLCAPDLTLSEAKVLVPDLSNLLLRDVPGVARAAEASHRERVMPRER